jgi:divalent metal cation (Fe/Co/Zn/Cd) transporter
VEDNKNSVSLHPGIRLIKRTKLLVIMVALAGVVLYLAGPRLVERLMNRRSPLLTGAPRYWGMLMGGFVCAVLLYRLLYLLYGLLNRAEREKVLTRGCLHALDGITRCCFMAGLVTGLMGFTCLLSFLAISVAAFFMALILRVFRHVFAAAVDKLEKEDHNP